jgi:hypothetical protein
MRCAWEAGTTTESACGMGIGLWDGILIKENHIAACGGIAQALDQARALNAGVPVQIEVESLKELHSALEADAESILLDDFDIRDLAAAVALNAGRALLEVSRGVRLYDRADCRNRCGPNLDGRHHQRRAGDRLVDALCRVTSLSPRERPARFPY